MRKMEGQKARQTERDDAIKKEGKEETTRERERERYKQRKNKAHVGTKPRMVPFDVYK